MSQRIAIVGATRGMGREVARRLAERGDHLALLGRDPEALEAAKADLMARGAADVSIVACDLASADAHGPALVHATFAPALDAASEALGGIETVVVTAGLFGTQEQLEADADLRARVLDVNFTKTILFCEHARTLLLEQGGGSLVVFSSVAGDTARKTVGLYGATKAGLSHYLGSLDRRYHSQGLHVLLVKPGFVRTGMTAGLKEPPFAGEPDAVSRDVVAAMSRRAPVLYTPRIWQLVMLVVMHLPRSVMRKVGF
jgi:decaprenylphospho-beta-D-erythro-pentofuranosid-2-ulose 2-reductase